MSTPIDQAHIRVTMDIVLSANGEDHDYLAQRMNSALFGAIHSESLLTLDSDAQVHTNNFKTALLSDEAAALTEAQVTQWLAGRIQSGALPAHEIPALLARLALSDPGDIREEMAEQMSAAAPPQAQVNSCMYALGPTIEHGLRGGFSFGPAPAFDPHWMSGDEIIMRLSEDGSSAIAYEEMTAHAGAMSVDIFKMIYIHGRSLYENAVDTVELSLLNKLIDASPFDSSNKELNTVDPTDTDAIDRIELDRYAPIANSQAPYPQRMR